jgi:ferric-dicitrate binding protein FerR (iron transport regulator)
MSERPEDWDELFLRYLGGEADPELERRVRGRLLSDPSARDRLVTLACQQQALADVLSDAAQGTSSSRSLAPRPRRTGPDLRWMLAVAAVAVAAVGLLFFRSDGNSPTPRKESSPPPKAEARTPEKAVRPAAEVRQPVPAPKPPPPPAPETEKKEPIVPPPLPKPVEKEPTAPRTEDPQPPPPAPKPESPARGTTETAVATIERVEGEVAVVSAESRTAAVAKRSILPGQGLETFGAAGSVEISYPDGTRMKLDPGTLVTDISDGEKKGKRLFLARGGLWASVRKQPADQPMTLSTPNGEARVLGTRLRLLFDEKTSTRLEVEEGKVRLKRLSDGKTADVVTGHFAVVAAGTEMKPLPRILLGLVGYWRFEEAGGTAVADVSGLGNHGAVTGNARRVLGKFGQALELDGASAVNVPHAANLNPGLSSWSVAAWIRKSDEYQTTAIYKDDDGKFRSYYFLAAGTKPRFEFSSGDAKVNAEGKSSVNDGKWHHVAGVRTAPYSAQIYVDGILEAEATVPPTASPSIVTSSPLRFGNSTPIASGLGPWKGGLDDVRVYDRALSAEEVKQLFLGR